MTMTTCCQLLIELHQEFPENTLVLFFVIRILIIVFVFVFVFCLLIFLDLFYRNHINYFHDDFHERNHDQDQDHAKFDLPHSLP